MALWRSSASQRSSREAQKQLMQWIGEVSAQVHPSSSSAAIRTFAGKSAVPGSCASPGARCWRIQEVADLSLANSSRATSAAPTASGIAAAILRAAPRGSVSSSSHRQLITSSTCAVTTPGSSFVTRSTAALVPSSSVAACLSQSQFSTRVQGFHRAAASSLTISFRTQGLPSAGAPRLIPFASRFRSAFHATPCPLTTQAVSLDTAVSAAAASAGAKGISLSQQLRGHLQSYYELSKTRLSLLVVATAAAGFVMGSGEHVDWALCARTCAGTFLAAASANSFNQAWEVHSDAAMKRTCRRPLPSGRISRPHALLWATAAGASGVLLLLPPLDTSSSSAGPSSDRSSSAVGDSGTSPAPATLLPAALAASNIGLYALVYTPLKQIHPINTWVGALVGAIPPLIGWSAASGESLLQWPAASGGWLWATVLLFWQMPHFHALSWLCREDYRRGGYKMLTVVDPTGRRAGASALVNCLFLLPLPALSSSLGVTSPEFAVGATAVTMAFTAAALPFYRSPSPTSAKTLFRLSLLHLPAYMAAMTACRMPHSAPLTAQLSAAQPLAQQQVQQDSQRENQGVVGSGKAAFADPEGGVDEGRLARGGSRPSLGPPLQGRAPPVAYASAAPFPFLPLPV